MTEEQKKLYGDIDDLLTLAGGYLIALRQYGKNDALAGYTERVIKKISKRYRKEIDEVYAPPAKPHPDSIDLKGCRH